MLQGLATTPPGYLLGERIEGLSSDSANVTVSVQQKANGTITEKHTIDMSNITNVYCNLDPDEWATFLLL